QLCRHRLLRLSKTIILAPGIVPDLTEVLEGRSRSASSFSSSSHLLFFL
ncbi:hypothetical protein CSUI_005083, partial [Cystoisospora suis]